MALPKPIFDPKINLGHIITLLGILFVAWITVKQTEAKAEQLEEQLKIQINAHSSDVRYLNEGLQNLDAVYVRKDVFDEVKQQIRDNKALLQEIYKEVKK